MIGSSPVERLPDLKSNKNFKKSLQTLQLNIFRLSGKFCASHCNVNKKHTNESWNNFSLCSKGWRSCTLNARAALFVLCPSATARVEDLQKTVIGM